MTLDGRGGLHRPSRGLKEALACDTHGALELPWVLRNSPFDKGVILLLLGPQAVLTATILPSAPRPRRSHQRRSCKVRGPFGTLPHRVVQRGPALIIFRRRIDLRFVQQESYDGHLSFTRRPVVECSTLIIVPGRHVCIRFAQQAHYFLVAPQGRTVQRGGPSRTSLLDVRPSSDQLPNNFHPTVHSSFA